MLFWFLRALAGFSALKPSEGAFSSHGINIVTRFGDRQNRQVALNVAKFVRKMPISASLERLKSKLGEFWMSKIVQIIIFDGSKGWNDNFE